MAGPRNGDEKPGTTFYRLPEIHGNFWLRVPEAEINRQTRDAARENTPPHPVFFEGRGGKKCIIFSSRYTGGDGCRI